ncbi:hypothetical protein [Cardiobacterium valvarum]|uniref:Uncharacterized protein n=1 Tax=Cardiobacterium valvarum TaxID=194702 RepID=A0A381EFH2_9GAMM|nr:hypothetical protein [Cardiobacterium valvarum]SUX25679.1 Uncharacterised protein [Cardiobacterium valvarum]
MHLKQQNRVTIPLGGISQQTGNTRTEGLACFNDNGGLVRRT